MNIFKKLIGTAIVLAWSMTPSMEAQVSSGSQISVKERVKAVVPSYWDTMTNTRRKLLTEVDYDIKHEHPLNVAYFVRMDKGNAIDVTVKGGDIQNINNPKSYYRESFVEHIRQINDYTIYIAGNDGKVGRAIGTTHAISSLKDYPNYKNAYSQRHYFCRKDIVNRMLDFGNAPECPAIPVKDVEMVVYPDNKRGSLNTGQWVMRNHDTSWVQKTGLVNTNYGARVFGLGKVKTRLGEYEVTFYSTDGDSGMYETVVIQRNDGLRCKVDELAEIKYQFVTDDGEEDSIVIYYIRISDPTIGKFTIIDDVMYKSLMTLKDDTVNNKAIRFKAYTHINQYFIDEDGVHEAIAEYDEDNNIIGYR